MYTLVSASVLALDLARHPRGAAVADVVDAALALDAGTVSASHAPVLDLDRAAARQRLLAAADRAPRLEHVLRTVSTSLAEGAGAGAARTLQAALVGRLDDLLVLLARELGEVRGLPGDVVDVVLDRAVAAWAGSCAQVAPADVVALSAPWTGLVGELPPPLPRDGAVPQLLELLEQVSRLDRDTWCALDSTHDAVHRALSWSSLLHVASRAAVEADRTVAVARWQLSAVRATAATGHVRSTCTPGAVMSIVGAVQALALHDGLPAEAADGLLEPCRRALGLRLRPGS